MTEICIPQSTFEVLSTKKNKAEYAKKLQSSLTDESKYVKKIPIVN